MEAAEAEGHGLRAREVLLDRVIDLAIERRGAASMLQFDPVIVRLQAEHKPFQRFIERLYRVLVGEAGDEAACWRRCCRARSRRVVHPLVADIDDETLRCQLRRITAPAHGSGRRLIMNFDFPIIDFGGF